MRTRITATGLLTGGLAIVALAGAGVVASRQAAEASLAGAWVLNRDASDDPRQVTPGGPGDDGARRGPGGGRPPGGMGPGGGGGRGLPGGGRGPGGARPSEEEMRRLRDLMRELMEPAERLTIVVGDDSVSMTDQSGRTTRYATNGKPERHQLDAGTVETKTRWDGSRLIKETKADGGLTLSETYALAPEGRQLNVTVKMERARMPGPPRVLTRVYESLADEDR
jgi:hypothetical protein